MHTSATRILLAAALACGLLAGSGCSWFVLGGAAITYFALQETNSAPAVSVETPDRLLSSPGEIHYTLFDPDGDACDVHVEFSAGGGAWMPATPGAGGEGTSGLSAASGGAGHVFSWDYAQDQTPPVAGVRVRITAEDENGSESRGESGFFDLGNVPPAIETVDLPQGVVTGTATIRYTISDTKSDPARIEVQFNREAAGGTWAAATPADPIAADNLATAPAPGVQQLFPWNSAAASNLPNENALVRIRIRASDDAGTTWGAWTEASGTVAILNDGLTRLEIGTVGAFADGQVRIPFTCFGNGTQVVTVLCEYRLFGESVWRRATQAEGTRGMKVTATAGGAPGAFLWDSRRDAVFSRGVTVRLTPSEERFYGLGAKVSFAVGNDGLDAIETGASLPATRLDASCASVGERIYLIGGHDGASVTAGVLAWDPASNAWTPRTPMPTARRGLACATLGGKIYAVGGFDGSVNLDAVEVYDPETDTWQVEAPMSTLRGYPVAAAVLGNLYVAGGHDGTSVLASAESFDPATGAWSTESPMGTGRQYARAEAVGGVLAVFGGHDGTSFLDTVERFDAGTGAWSGAAPMPRTRGRSASAVLGGRVYLAGGENGAGVLDAVDEYDPEADTWRALSPLGSPRCLHAGAAAGGKAVWAGGWDGVFPLDAIEVATPPSDAWRAGTSMPTGRGYAGTAGMQGRLYVAGGKTATSPLDSMQVFDAATGAWSSAASMPATRERMACASFGGMVYVMGGDDGSLFHGTVFAYDPGADAWTQKTNMPTARYSLSAAAVGRHIYALGGRNATASLASAEAYDPAADTWQALPPMPTARDLFAAVASGGRIFALGGRSGSDYIANVEAFDPVSNTWGICADMPTARAEIGAAEAAGCIFAIAGWNGDLLDVVEIYDPLRDLWGAGTPIPGARGEFSCENLGGRIYALGGYNGVAYLSAADIYSPLREIAHKTLDPLAEGAGGAVLVPVSGRAVLAGGRRPSSSASASSASYPLFGDIDADPAVPFFLDPVWSAGPDLAQARRDAAGAALGGAAYVAGGFDGSGAPLDSLERYDPSASSWTAVAASMTQARGGLGAAGLGGRLYLFGGDTGGGSKTGALEVYDDATGDWAPGPFASMNTARSHFGFAEYGGRIYVFGGEGNAGAFLATAERYDPALDRWETLGDLPAAVKGALCLPEAGGLRLFGGEVAHATLSGVVTDRIYAYDPAHDLWRLDAAVLPYPARDLFGCTVLHAWMQRGVPQTGEFCLLGGGRDGTATRSGFFRVLTR
jgi:N-acetylneuraminic acid mutarotase